MRALMRRLIARKGGRRPRKGRPERWRRHLPLAVALLGFSAGVAVGAWQLWHGGYVHRATDGIAQWGQRQMVAAGLTVRHVFVTGRGETSKAAVLKAVAVRTGQPILSFDPAAARDRLVAMGWIKSARIERRLPDTIIVHLRERAPLALWQYQGRHLLIDREGAPITRRNLGRFGHLPVVIGRDAPAHAAGLLDMLAARPVLFAQVKAAVRVGSRRWNLRLKNGIEVNLPEHDAAAAWSRLAELVAEKRIFERDVAAIDLRLPDRLVVRMTPRAAAKKKRKNGKDT